MTDSIAITTGCRLHFGIFAHRPESGREFGGVGLMLDHPRTHLSFRAAVRDEVIGPERATVRVRALVARYRKSVGESRQPPAVSIEIHDAIPPHVGLGSGTQTALAVARGLSRLAGEREVNSVALAARVGRGVRSAIGIHGFERGGFIVDDGKSPGESIGALAAHAVFPDAWRVLLVTPPDDPGLFGPAEREAFAKLPPMPSATTVHLRRIAFDAIFPAIRAADMTATGESLYEFNRIVGEYFAPAQGGVYAHPRMRELVAELRGCGMAGIGQSSWGPTIFILARNVDEAEELRRELASSARWSDCTFHIAAAT